MKKFLIATIFLPTLLLTVNARALEHRELMWGIQNRGELISIDLNPLQSYRIQGVVHQDIHLLPPVKGRKIKVAVVDTGIDLEHPDLKNFIYKNQNKCEAYEKLKKCQTEKKDTDSLDCREQFLQAEDNIYPADCFGWSVLDQGLRNADGKAESTPNNIIGRPDFTDPAGHGTHVAGTILSVTENVEIIPVQVSGIGPNQPIKPFSIDLSPNENIRGGFQTSTNLSERVARGIIYAMNSGAQVINFSLGWPEDQNTDIIREVIIEAQRRGIIIVAAAGNDSTNALLRPCQYKNVICVAAHRPDGALASFSNYGLGVDIAAPGVEILSTIPSKDSSVRLLGFLGYDYLSGTSQATPFVTGVVAEMLSRGISASEIYPRLILGARAIQKELPVIQGPVNGVGVPIDSPSSYKKNILSGLLDMQNSMQVQAQALILPADKETQVIEWDRHSADLSFQFQLKNYWKSIENKKVTIQLRSTTKSEIEPAIIQAEIINNKNQKWATSEERTVQVKLQIRDQKNPSLSRIPRELSYQVYVMVDGKLHRQFEVKAEVLSNFTKDIIDPEITTIPIKGIIPAGSRLFAVNQIFDFNLKQKDYFLIGTDPLDKKAFNISLMKMTNNQNQDQYEIQPTQKVAFDGDISQWRPKYQIRMDIDGDGVSEYIFGVIEYLDKELGITGPYRNHFYVFDLNMNLKKSYLFDDKRLALPIDFYWMKVGQQMRPAWVAKGPEIKKKWDITDLWGVDDLQNVKTKSDIHFYFLDEEFKLTHSSVNSLSRIVDIIQPTKKEISEGVLPVLIAKNSGTELKPSYISEFSVGEMLNGVLVNEKKINSFNSSLQYRNLIDTFADRAFSLNTSATEYSGTMWYGLDAHQKQRVTLLDLEQNQIYDQMISSQRAVFDAALQIRAGFQSVDRRGVFLITNSEIEYHDLSSPQVATRSLNRFSFLGESSFIQLQFPITILDRNFPGKKLPGLFTTEGSGLNRGLKIMIPVYSKNGLIEKIVSPARLSFKSTKGCRSLGDPVFLGEGSGYAIDYYCGDQIKRLLLKY